MTEGTVALVGAGPGDPGLLTIRGRDILESADVVVYDRLVGAEVLRLARPDADLIDVGKIPGEGGRRQAEINDLLVAEARAGRSVVRLKGGDPFVFGRGGEEAAWLREHGIAFEVVPGVTSAIAAPAYAGIPLTHRDVASSFTVVTASESPDKPDSSIAWDKLAQGGGTLVVLMGWRNLADVTDTLIRHGRPPDTPAAVVQWGTEPYQRTVAGTLSNIDSKARDAGLSAPAVVVVGNVVSLRSTLRWFDVRPLFGKRVLVTRTRSQAGKLARLLRERGAHAIELPTIEIRPLSDYGPLDRALGRLFDYAWVVFTSANAVDAVFARLAAMALDARAFVGIKVAAIGPATVDALAGQGLRADLVPDVFTSSAVADALRGRLPPGARVLLPRADIAPDSLREGLAANGAEVDDVTAYRTVAPETTAHRLESILTTGIDAATFTSSSTVRNLLRAVNGKADRISGATIACIGPVTAGTAREMGLKVDIVAEVHTVDGLVSALERHLAKESRTRE
jgi:uroporphyrinogen III methyltransferase/synthase